MTLLGHSEHHLFLEFIYSAVECARLLCLSHSLIDIVLAKRSDTNA